jgi:hypothetical protein
MDHLLQAVHRRVNGFDVQAQSANLTTPANPVGQPPACRKGYVCNCSVKGGHWVCVDNVEGGHTFVPFVVIALMAGAAAAYLSRRRAAKRLVQSVNGEQ